MASRKRIDIYIPKYFMVVRKCTNTYIPKYFCTSRGSFDVLEAIDTNFVGQLGRAGWGAKTGLALFSIIIL